MDDITLKNDMCFIKIDKNMDLLLAALLNDLTVPTMEIVYYRPKLYVLNCCYPLFTTVMVSPNIMGLRQKYTTLR
jgi:hypothetical protein